MTHKEFMLKIEKERKSEKERAERFSKFHWEQKAQRFIETGNYN